MLVKQRILAVILPLITIPCPPGAPIFLCPPQSSIFLPPTPAHFIPTSLLQQWLGAAEGVHQLSSSYDGCSTANVVSAATAPMGVPPTVRISILSAEPVIRLVCYCHRTEMVHSKPSESPGNPFQDHQPKDTDFHG